MKTICDLSGAEFLRHCNKVRYAVQDVLNNTKVMEIRKRMPTFTGKETEAEQKALIDAQGVKNFSDMLDRLLDENPEETYKLLRAFVVTDEGEKEPDGWDLLSVAAKLMRDRRVIDFLSSLLELGQTNTEG